MHFIKGCSKIDKDELVDSLSTLPPIPPSVLLSLSQLKQFCSQPPQPLCASKLELCLDKIPPDIIFYDWTKLILIVCFIQHSLSSRFEKKVCKLRSLFLYLAF